MGTRAVVPVESFHCHVSFLGTVSIGRKRLTSLEDFSPRLPQGGFCPREVPMRRKFFCVAGSGRCPLVRPIHHGRARWSPSNARGVHRGGHDHHRQTQGEPVGLTHLVCALLERSARSSSAPADLAYRRPPGRCPPQRPPHVPSLRTLGVAFRGNHGKPCRDWPA